MAKTFSRKKELPEGYYLSHFQVLVDFYSKNYGFGFSSRIDTFLSKYNSLSEMEKRLIIRLANLKSNFHKPNEVTYSDIPNTKKVFESITSVNFLSPLKEEHTVDLIENLNKDSLMEVLEENSIPCKKSWKKEKLLSLSMKIDKNVLCQWANKYYLTESFVFEIELLRFLYFGHYSRDLSLFSLRDLGIRKTSEFEITESTLFDSYNVAEEEYIYAKMYKDLKKKSVPWITNTYGDQKNLLPPKIDFYKSGIYFNRLLLELSRIDKFTKETINNFLSLASGHPARMKRARLLYKDNQKDLSRESVIDIIDSPTCDEEFLEAQDFLNLKFGEQKKSQLSILLDKAKVLKLDDSYRSRVEKGVISALKNDKTDLFFAENNLWIGLFSILFWDELFQGMNNEFERVPRMLVIGTFYEKNKCTLIEKTNNLFSKETRFRIIKTFTENYGKKNNLFRWRKNILEKLLKIIDAKPSGLPNFLLEMAKNYTKFKSGFPDLISISDNEFKLIEVKGEGDVLRRNQLAILSKLESYGFSVEVLKVEFIFDPNQTYVVVDVETTGGRAHDHRVIEIGAVKIRNFEIIDEFSTLIDPERSIPPFITRLTGITQNCVIDAPKFSEIAQDFLDFCEGSIFAAHNVSFDYSFIRAEFQRLNRRFQFPRFCTCARARTYLKGPKSYGLASICEYFGIELNNHHRALCDARAAGSILMLINEKRLKAAKEEAA